MPDIYLSIVIPAYNEKARIGATLDSIAAYLKGKPFKAEVIVVDDGSSDGTADFVRGFGRKFKHLEVVENDRNRGKGAVVKQGMLLARGKLRLFMDADNSITIDNFDRFQKHIEAGADIVIGSIELPGSHARDDNQWYRRALGKVCKVIIRSLVTPNIYDTIRGFKLFTAAAAEPVFQTQTIDRFGFDTELVAIAQTKGLVIQEIEVKWDNPAGNSVNLGSYIFGFWELMKIKNNLIIGAYGDKSSFKCRSFIKKHIWAIVFAVLIGIATVGPQFIFIQSLGSSYQGLYMMKGDAEPYYLARIHEAYAGDISFNPFIYEDKYSVPPGSFSLADPILAVPGIIFNLSVPVLALIYKFLLPAIVAFLIYLLFFRMTGKRAWSIVAMCAVMLGYNFMNAPDIPHLLRLDTAYPSFWGFTTYSRPIYPQFSSIFFFSYLNLLFIALKEHKWKWYICLGFVFGASFYVYIFDMTFIAALAAVFIAGLFLARRRKDAAKLAASMFIGIVVGSYFIYDMIAVTRSPYYADFADSLKLVMSHIPFVSVAGCITLAIFIGYLFLKKRLSGFGRSQTDWFLLGLLATAFVVINQQVITGHLLQEGHYHWYFNVPIFTIVLIYVLLHILKNRRMLAMVAIIAITLVSFGANAFVSYSSYVHWHDSVAFDQRYMPLMKWLNASSTPQSVVFANEDISALVPIYTFDNVVWEYLAGSYLLPKERILFTPDNIFADGFTKDIRKYRVDYVVWDTVKDPSWKMDQYKILREVYETGGLKVYSFK